MCNGASFIVPLDSNLISKYLKLKEISVLCKSENFFKLKSLSERKIFFLANRSIKSKPKKKKLNKTNTKHLCTRYANINGLTK